MFCLLLPLLSSFVGSVNSDFVELIRAFLPTDILDQKGENHACTKVGLPQGSPISPALMNFFLHRLDTKLSQCNIMVPEGKGFGECRVPIYYARYAADDMLIGIPLLDKKPTPSLVRDKLKNLLLSACRAMKIGLTWSTIERESH